MRTALALFCLQEKLNSKQKLQALGPSDLITHRSTPCQTSMVHTYLMHNKSVKKNKPKVNPLHGMARTPKTTAYLQRTM